jgi:acyl carrier protein
VLALGMPPQIAVSPVMTEPAALANSTASTLEAGSSTAGDSAHNRPDLVVEYAGPTNDLEQDICAIWQELLGIQTVGIHDNFFDLGGHSLLATQLMSRMRRAFDVELSLKEFFDAPTVAGMAELLMAKLLDEENTTLTE